jgi:ATP-dependent helicase HrpA
VAAALSHLGGVSVPLDAFQEDRLPAELRMNVRVTDAEGRLLAAGRDLEAIRTELGQQAAESFSETVDPRWSRDGLTEWDFDELPAAIELPRGRLSVTAYPALLDRGQSVALRLVDSPERAEYETHFGLRRLCLLAAEGELRAQVDWLPSLAKMKLHAATLPGFDLGRQLVELLAERAMVADQPVPRTKDQFAQFLAAGRGRIAWAVQELIALVGPIFEGFHQAHLAIDNVSGTGPVPPSVPGTRRVPSGKLIDLPLPDGTRRVPDTAPRWQYAIDDIRQQIAHLMAPQGFSKVPWQWLRQYPRYFRAICGRLENLPAAVPRDFEKFQEFQPRWQLFLEQARHDQNQAIFDPELMHLRWMLEEYRVSLFAQKLGTAIPVSPKRLEQQWAKLRG